MSCCPEAPPIKVSDGTSGPNAGPESEMLPGESVECYAARAGNQSGKLDDATENVENKIENTNIPINAANVSVNTTFKLTSNSTRTPTTWTLTKGGSPWAVSGVTFTSSGATASLSGPFPSTEYDKPYEVLLTASDGTGQIDARTFKFSPSKASNTNSIKLISPLPGSIVNSKFGPRVHPISKVQKMHTGIDMKFANRSTADVISACDGEVTFAGVSGTLNSGYGNCIRIKHMNGSGQMLCSTLYGHLAKIYVTVGQKVSAGQRIGYEGTTGSSTGNHLHFECRLPNGSPTDPIPYIEGGVPVSDTTTPSGNAGSTPIPSGDTGAAVTSAGVNAQSTPCPPGPVDPQTGAVAPTPPPYVPPPVPGADPFEKAWYFTMTYEVGPHWMTQPQYSPGNPDLDAGLYTTPLQRKQVGYKPGPNYPGGETKFGIAQNPNQGKISVSAVAYDPAKSFGKSNYWSVSGPSNCASWADLCGILIFDMNYLHGVGGARAILASSGQPNVPPGASQAVQLAACEVLTKSCLAFVSGLNPKFRDGWTNRANSRLGYVKSLTYPLA